MLFLILRLALVGVLKLQARSLGLLAPVCSSMGFLAASQTKRSFIVPLGDFGNPHVFSGNLLAIRPNSIHLETIEQKHSTWWFQWNPLIIGELGQGNFDMLGAGSFGAHLPTWTACGITIPFFPTVAVLLQIHLYRFWAIWFNNVYSLETMETLSVWDLLILVRGCNNVAKCANQ